MRSMDEQMWTLAEDEFTLSEELGQEALDSDMDDLLSPGTIDYTSEASDFDEDDDFHDEDDDSDDEDDDPDDGDAEVSVADYDAPDLLGSAVEEYGEFDNFDPSRTDMSQVIGNPAGSMEHWHLQEGQTCAVVAQEFILNEQFGTDFTEQFLEDYATQAGYYLPGMGTPPHDVGNIMLDAGMRVTRSYNSSFDNLIENLQDGHGVLVSVSSDSLWSHGNNEIFMPGIGADHVVQVIGIDYSGNEPQVIINDSGIADGCGILVDADDFVEAWSAGGYYMISAEVNTNA